MNKKDKRKLKWGLGIFILGFIILYIVIETSPAKSLVQSSSMFGPIGLLMAWPVIFSSPFGIFAFFMILFGMALLLKLATEKIRDFFGM